MFEIVPCLRETIDFLGTEDGCSMSLETLVFAYKSSLRYNPEARHRHSGMSIAASRCFFFVIAVLCHVESPFVT